MRKLFHYKQNDNHKYADLHTNTQEGRISRKKSSQESVLRKITAFAPFLIMLFMFISLPSEASATGSVQLELNKKYPAELEKCIDGDTAYFKIGDEVYRTRFLYIDTPESIPHVEPFGEEATNFSCEMMKNAKEIILETDGPSLYDKFDRLLAWVWVDGKLLQEEITKEGLVKKFYDYGDYQYEEKLHQAMNEAKEGKKEFIIG